MLDALVGRAAPVRAAAPGDDVRAQANLVHDGRGRLLAVKVLGTPDAVAEEAAKVALGLGLGVLAVVARAGKVLSEVPLGLEHGGHFILDVGSPGLDRVDEEPAHHGQVAGCRIIKVLK